MSELPTPTPVPSSRPAPEPTPVARLATQEGERIQVLDAVRGLAILGIVPANLPSFTLPLGAVFASSQLYRLSPATSEALAFFQWQAFVDRKFITLFSLLFGVGIALQRERSLARGESADDFDKLYLWRLTLLAALGAGHAVFLWSGDILFTYAVCGVVPAIAFTRIDWRLLFPLGIVLVLISAGFMALLSLAIAASGSTASELGLNPAKLLEEERIFREGTYLEQLAFRLPEWIQNQFGVLFVYGARFTGLFALGMGFHSLGLFKEPERFRRLTLGLVLAGLGIGLPLEVTRALLRSQQALSPSQDLLWDAIHDLSSLLLALAYAAGLLRLSPGRFRCGPLRLLVNAGRLSLTCYLAETVIGVTLFYSWGFGLYGQLSRLELWGVSGLIVLALPLLASAWLLVFRMGPVEWAWRSAALLSWQPLLRRRS